MPNLIVAGGVEVAAAGSTEEVFDIEFEFEGVEAAGDPLPEGFRDADLALILMSSGLLSTEYASTPWMCLIG